VNWDEGSQMAEKKKFTNPYASKDLVALKALLKTFKNRIKSESIDAVRSTLERELKQVIFALKKAKFAQMKIEQQKLFDEMKIEQQKLFDQFKKEEQELLLELKDLGWKPKSKK